MVCKKTLARSAGPENKFISIGDDPFFDRLIRNIYMNRPAREAIAKPDPDRTYRRPVIGFEVEKTAGLLGEQIKTVIHRKIGLVTRYARPVDLWRTIQFLFGYSI